MNLRNFRYPSLDKNTEWMLCRVQPDLPGKVPVRGKWLEVRGWCIEWGDEPSVCCPIFRKENIREEFHSGLYGSYGSVKGFFAGQMCALCEVRYVQGKGYVPTGRIRSVRLSKVDGSGATNDIRDFIRELQRKFRANLAAQPS